VGEFHYIHHARDGRAGTEMSLALREAARDAGIRIVLLPVFYQRGGFDRPAVEEQRRFLHASLEDFGKLLEALRGEPCGVAPHSLRAVPLSHLPELVALANSILGPGCPIHIHVSEQRREVEECRAFHGRPPIECLDDTVELGPRWSLVHATHAQAHEIAIIGEKGPNLVLCPLTEAYLGDGLFPLDRANGLQFAIGSDSNARIDAIEELRLAEYGQRLRLEKRALLANERGLGSTLWASVAAAGARSLAQPVGRLEAGSQADIVVLNLQDELFAGVQAGKLLDAWIVGGSSAQVSDVYVGGRRRVAQGALVSPVVADRFANVMKRVFGD
jgi:formimidoylglutamate deiminase